MLNKKKIVVTGGTGRFGKILKKQVGKEFFFPNKRELNILKLNNLLSQIWTSSVHPNNMTILGFHSIYCTAFKMWSFEISDLKDAKSDQKILKLLYQT